MNVYCDGCAINNGKPNVYGGYGVYFPKYIHLNISEPFILNNCTNQRTEIYAMYIALKIINEISSIDDISSINEISSIDEIYIYSDSIYTIKCITEWIPKWEKNNWKKSDGKDVLNKDLLLLLWDQYNLVKTIRSLKLIHINSHTGKTDEHSLGNKEADRLAVNGANKKLK
jgi:ribonuclease HI